MTLKEYQETARKTAVFPPVMIPGHILEGGVEELVRLDLVYPTLGLTGEAGEFANKVKKIIRDSAGVITDVRRKDLLDELGDVLWYVSACVTALDGHLETVAENNLEKLADRQRRGKLQGEGDKR